MLSQLVHRSRNIFEWLFLFVFHHDVPAIVRVFQNLADTFQISIELLALFRRLHFNFHLDVDGVGSALLNFSIRIISQ